MIKLNFKGSDITEKVSINACIHDMYAEDRADSLFLRVNDIAGVWDSWQPQVGDEIRIDYGAIGTGRMFVYECVPTSGQYTIKATAAPLSYKSKFNKAWQKVRLKQMGQEIAGRHGLAFASYDVEDHMYEYVLQANENDFSFLNRRAALEGCALIINDGTLIMYKQSAMECQSTSESLKLTTATDYEYHDNTAHGYGSCELERGGYKGSYSAGNGLAAVYRPSCEVYVGSSAEASRFAKGLLRYVNKNTKHGWCKGYVMPGYAAGSCAVLSNERAPSWDGVVFLTHVRNDYVACQSKIFFRKPLGGY